MLKMVDGTGIIGVDMICPLGVSTPQPPNYDRVELEGTGMLVLPNSLDAPLERLELDGKTEQVQTTGKNLVNANVYEQGYLTSVNAGDKVSLTQMQKSFTTNMEVSSMQGKNVSVSVRTKGKTGKKYVFTDETDTIITGVFDTGNNNYSEFKNITIPQNAKKLFLSVTYDVQENAELQVELGTTVTTYEPYTGNKPSPSPEYPQEIKSVGRLNEDTGKYEVDVKVTGKNLFDKRLLEGGEVVEFNGVECYKYIDNPYNFKYKGKFENGQQYAFTLRILRSASKESNITDMVIVYTDGSMKQMRFSHGELKTFVSDNGKTIDYFSGAHNFSIDCYLDLSVTRLSVGGQDAGYDPYKEQTLTLTSDRPITKWDKLVEQGGEIGWLYQSAIDTDVKPSRLDLFPHGFSLFKDFGNGVYVYKVVNIKKAIGFQTSLCEQFKNKDGSYSTGDLFCYSDQPSIQMQYFVTDIPTLEEFKTWMETNPLTMVYQTVESQFVPLPQSEQNAIRALKTYYPTTVITADGGELDPDIKVTYRKEI